jgi:molybdopterin converting factor subunit 1
MKIRLYLFARAREIVGESLIEYEIADGAEVAGLLSQLQAQYPGMAELEIKVAVNSEYAENNQQLQTGDEVAIIPPISGG